MKVLVCGGRGYGMCRPYDPPERRERAEEEKKRLFEALQKLKPTLIIHGNAAGADHWADEWALLNDIHVHAYAADWALHGKAAGPMRNQKMLDRETPDIVVAFPGGRGTADMVRRARRAGIDILEAKNHTTEETP